MKIILAHTKWMILELFRQPAYIVSTVAFPALFYIIFAIPESKDKTSSNLLLASFSCFANFGVLFLQFGVGIAQERSKSWHLYLRTLPVRSAHLILARFISSYFFALLSLTSLVILATVYTEFSLTLTEWVLFFLAHFLLGLIFCVMGITLGYWFEEKSALPVGNLIYLPLTFAGGLWKPPGVLPESLKTVSEWLPTRHYGEVLWSIVLNQKLETDSLFIWLFMDLFF
jgi:ABC-2 type transport system permease protein